MNEELPVDLPIATIGYEVPLQAGRFVEARESNLLLEM